MSERFIDAVLSDPSHRLPMPGTARLFSLDGEKVDLWDGFWLTLLADGSIKPKPAPAAAPVAAPAPAIKPAS